jgi:hypothetical protein
MNYQLNQSLSEIDMEIENAMSEVRWSKIEYTQIAFIKSKQSNCPRLYSWDNQAHMWITRTYRGMKIKIDFLLP